MMLEVDESFAQRICDLLFEISQDTFSLDDEAIESEPQADVRAVLTGLLMLHDELRFQNDQRALAEVQVLRREARLRAIIDLAKVAIWDCSVRGVIQQLETVRTQSNGKPLEQRSDLVQSITDRLVIHSVNHEALKMLRADSKETLEAHVRAVASSGSAKLFGALWRGVAEGKTRVEAEGTLTTVDGEELTVLAGLSVPSSELEEDVAILTLADITAHHARVAAEQEAARRTEELARVNAEVERLFYAVAHDLRSPLRAVDTLASWVVEDLEAGELDEVKKHIGTLRSRIDRLDRMLNDLLSYARIGRTQHAVELVDVGGLLTEVTTTLLQIPAGFLVHWGDMPKLTTHRTLLSQVFLNLISNAIKHHDRDAGSIEIQVEEKGEGYVFRVRDDGPGIPLTYRQRIFGLFSTLKRRDEVEGSGMGLAFVQKVVRRMGGQIVVEGPEGRGTCFVFDWPRRTPLPDEPREDGTHHTTRD
jgi:signal transduction histidine kinase